MIFTLYYHYTRKYKVIVYEFLPLKLLFINKGESNTKLPIIFACKNLQMTQKNLLVLI